MKNVLLLTLFFTGCFIGNLSAQRINCILLEDDSRFRDIIKSNEEGWISFAPLIVSKEEVFAKPNPIFNIPDDVELVEFSSQTDEINNTDHETVKFKQYYKDIPLECGILIGHWENCFLTLVNGDFSCDLDFDLSKIISPEEAIQSALDAHPSDEYIWKNDAEEQALREDEDDDKATHYPSPELLINCKEELVYRLTITSLSPSFSWQLDVDANDGTILNTESNIIECFHSHTASNHAAEHSCTDHTHHESNIVHESSMMNTTTGSTLFNGLQTLFTKWSSGKYRLKDEVSGVKFETRDAQGSNDQTISFGSCEKMELEGLSNNVWSPTDVRTTSVHWCASQCKQYFSQTLGTSVGAGKRLKVKANMGLTSAYYWPEDQSINFGSFNPLLGAGYSGVLDVVGHEFTHYAVDLYNDLIYWGESGALNESFADIFGYMIDRRVNGGTDWIIGERIGVPVRDLQNPGSLPIFGTIGGAPACGSTGQPDTYLGVNWANTNVNCDRGGVHINSGVQNRWFSLLSEGGTLNGVTVQGISQEKAAKIAWRNFVHYIVANSDYRDSRNGAVQAAIDLYGNCSVEHIQTVLAWEAVGIGSLGNCYLVNNNSNPLVSTAFCSDDSNLPFNITLSSSSNQPVTWEPVTINIPFWNFVSSTASWSYTTSGANNNILTITSVDDANPGIYLFKYTDGDGNIGYVLINIVDCPGIVSPPNEDPNDRTCNLPIPEGDGDGLGDTNVTSRESSDTTPSMISSREIQIIPNPASEHIKLSGVTTFEYRITSVLGQIERSKRKAETNHIDISALPKGTYILSIYQNDTIVNKTFIKM